jgi:hypothetical protein
VQCISPLDAIAHEQSAELAIARGLDAETRRTPFNSWRQGSHSEGKEIDRYGVLDGIGTISYDARQE